jgi:hypothetical protein
MRNMASPHFEIAGPIDLPGGMASGGQSEIAPTLLDRLKRVGSSIVALKHSAVIGPTLGTVMNLRT